MRLAAGRQINRRVASILCALAWASAPFSSTATAGSLDPNMPLAVRVAACMDSVRARTGDGEELLDLERKYGVLLLPHLLEYTRDADSSVANKAYVYIFRLAENAAIQSDRQMIVERLLEDLRDHGEARVRQYLTRRLQHFRARDFSDRGKEILVTVFSGLLEGTYRNRTSAIILLLGVADVRSELPRLREVIDNSEEELKEGHRRELEELERRAARYGDSVPPGVRRQLEAARRKTYWQDTPLWHALRARARMGVKEDIQRCIEMVASHPHPDARGAGLLSSLSYVRQPEVVGYISEYLDDDTMPSRGGSGNVVVDSYAAYAASALASMLEGFPLKSYRTSQPEKLAVARNWMAEQTEWKIIR